MSSTAGSSEITLSHAAAGYRAMLLAHGIRLGCKVTGVVILARLVSPAEHGLFAMGASVVFLLTLFRDFGISVAAVQSPILTEGQMTALRKLHIALGAGLVIVTLLVAPLAGWFYHEPRVPLLLGAMGTSFLLTGLSIWPRTLLSRGLCFRELNHVETAGALVGTLAMIVAAWFNAGAYAFVVFLLVSEAVMLAAARRYCRWQAREQADWRALRPLARIGLNITGYNLLLYGLQQMDTLLMGHWFGATPLGQYNRAGQLLIQPATHLVAPFNQVLLSTLSRLGPESPYFARHLRDTTNAIAHFTLPFAISCMVLPHDVVCLVLGAGWDEAAPLLRWLAVSAATSFVSSTSYVLVVATGHSVRLSQIAAVSLPVTLIGLWAGRQHGPVGLAIGLACANVGLLLPRLLWSTRQTPVCFRDFLDALTGPMFAAVLFTAGLLVGRILAHDTGFMMRLAISGIGGGIVVAVGLWWWPRLRMEYCALWAHLPFSRAPTTSFVGQ